MRTIQEEKPSPPLVSSERAWGDDSSQAGETLTSRVRLHQGHGGKDVSRKGAVAEGGGTNTGDETMIVVLVCRGAEANDGGDIIVCIGVLGDRQQRGHHPGGRETCEIGGMRQRSRKESRVIVLGRSQYTLLGRRYRSSSIKSKLNCGLQPRLY